MRFDCTKKIAFAICLISSAVYNNKKIQVMEGVDNSVFAKILVEARQTFRNPNLVLYLFV